MEKFTIRGGEVVITNDEIKINTSLLTAVKQIYGQSKVIFLIILVSVGLVSFAVIFDTESLPREIGLLGIGILLFYIILLAISALVSDLTTESTIERDTVEEIRYKERGKVRGSVFSIHYKKGDKSKIREFFLSPTWLGDPDQYKYAKTAFKNKDIEINIDN